MTTIRPILDNKFFAPTTLSVRRFSVTPVITAGAYSADDVIGGALRFRGLRGGTLQTIMISDKAAQAVTYNIVLFNSEPTAIADNAPNDIADADIVKIIYLDQLATGDVRTAFVSNSIHELRNLDAPLPRTTEDIWAFLTLSGSPTPTYVSTSDLTITLQVDTSGTRAGLSA